MKPAPYGWPRLSTAIFYRDACAMIDWLYATFGFAIRLKIEGEGGRIEHSDIAYGDAVVRVGSERTGGASSLRRACSAHSALAAIRMA